ncbi:MAG: Ig-like domain repeat protein [Solirubrobacteraceae bacterium]
MPRRSPSLLATLFAITALGILGAAAPARAATVSLFAAPTAAGAADCSTAADPCSITTAVTNANAASVADSVRIRMADGTYSLSAAPTALVVTFAGPSLTFEAQSGTPTLSGTSTVRVMSIDVASTVTLEGLTIRDGSTAGQGGGILNNGELTITRSTFVNNTASNGGAISSSSGSTLAVRDSTFSDNSATSVGGGALIVLGAATIERSALINNHAAVNGGGVNVQPAATLTVAHSTLAQNTSGSLGGAFSNLGTLNVESSTIAYNSASSGSTVASGNNNVTFAADIIGPQTAGGACNPAGTAIVDGGYNLDIDGTCVSSTTPATGSHNGLEVYGSSTYGAVLDAYLADLLADNGGPTRTFALLSSPSPATTLANPALAVVPPTFNLPVAVGGVLAACAVSDQRGVLPAADANCDVGSYAARPSTIALTASAASVTPNTQVTYTANVAPLPFGGTVSFNDGAGNPATAACSAKTLTNGTVTCTVAYPQTGTYQVTATFSGDIGFPGSTSAARTLTVAVPPSPPTPDPPPPPTPDPPKVLVCKGRQLALFDLRRHGNRQVIRGVALASLGGKKVTVTGDHGGGSVTVAVGQDGSFVARLPRPKSAETSYRATYGDAHSAPLKLTRHLEIVSKKKTAAGLRVVIRHASGGRVEGEAATVLRQDGCRKQAAYGSRPKFDKHGEVTVVLPYAAAPETVAVYRLNSKTNGTFTLPIVVRRGG